MVWLQLHVCATTLANCWVCYMPPISIAYTWRLPIFILNAYHAHGCAPILEVHRNGQHMDGVYELPHQLTPYMWKLSFLQHSLSSRRTKFSQFNKLCDVNTQRQPSLLFIYIKLFKYEVRVDFTEKERKKKKHIYGTIDALEVYTKVYECLEIVNVFKALVVFWLE